MTAYAFTGPSRLVPEDERAIFDAARNLAAFGLPTEIVTGAAHGFDMVIAHVLLDEWPGPAVLHRIVVPKAPHDQEGVADWIAHANRLGARYVVETAPYGSTDADAYRARNELMLERAQFCPEQMNTAVLVAGLRRRSFYRSGEWMTVNIAHRRKITVHVVDLPPTAKEAPTS